MRMLHPGADDSVHALKNLIDNPMSKMKAPLDLDSPDAQAIMEKEVDISMKDKPKERKKALEAFQAEEDKKDKVKA